MVENRDDDRRKRWDQRARFEEIRTDIARRLRRVCTGTPTVEFEALTARMARVYLKYEVTSSTWVEGSAVV